MKVLIGLIGQLTLSWRSICSYSPTEEALPLLHPSWVCGKSSAHIAKMPQGLQFKLSCFVRVVNEQRLSFVNNRYRVGVGGSIEGFTWFALCIFKHLNTDFVYLIQAGTNHCLHFSDSCSYPGLSCCITYLYRICLNVGVGAFFSFSFTYSEIIF